MNCVNAKKTLLALIVVLMLIAVLAGCNNKPNTVNSERVSPMSQPIDRVSALDMADAKRLSDGASKLIDAMKRPVKSFHFSYKAQENLTDDKTKPPQVGPVGLQADISPEEIDLTETRGSTTRASKAKYGDEVNWGMVNLATLGAMTSPTLVIAVGASVTEPPSTDLVGMVTADKFTFNTALASTTSQKVGLERARMVMTTIRNCKGTAWIAEDSGQLIKFNIDADFLDRNDHSWSEHYEGVVTPKQSFSPEMK